MTKFVLLAALAAQHTVNAITCYSCTAGFESAASTIANAGISCWSPVTTAPTNGQATAEITTGSNGASCERCTSKITLVDGFPKMIERGCEDTTALDNFKYGTTTCEAAASDLNLVNWFVEDNDNDVQNMNTCHHDCTSNNCNDVFMLTDLTVCGQIDTMTGKWCDWTDGIWKCMSGLYPAGVSTSTADPTSTQACVVSTTTVNTDNEFHQCVQCNSMTDGEKNGDACFGQATATDCNQDTGTYNSCYSSSAVIYDKHTGTMINEMVVKGCSTQALGTKVNQPDQCFWSDAKLTLASGDSDDTFYTQKNSETATYDQALELVCTRHCDSDGCNSGVPNGVVEEAEKTIYCAVYDSSIAATVMQDLNFDSTIQACPAGTTKCYSSVTYLLRDNNEHLFMGLDSTSSHANNLERVRIVEQKRGCWSDASAVTETKCEMDLSYVPGTNVAGLGMHKTTCSEICEGSGCNGYSWPNRPMCIRSDDMSTNIMDMHTVAKACATPADDTCYIAEYNFISPTSTYYRDPSHTFDYATGGADLGFLTTTSRGCTIAADNYFQTGCMKGGTRGSGAQHKNEYFESCNFTCTDMGCNFGTAYSGSFLKMFSPILVMVAMAMKNL